MSKHRNEELEALRGDIRKARAVVDAVRAVLRAADEALTVLELRHTELMMKEERHVADERWPTWLISYNLDGAQWSMSIVARDADDAMRRLKQAATWGTVER